MRKTLLVMALLLACMGLNAQNYHLNLHNNGSVVYDNDVNAIDDIRFQGHQPANMLINGQNGTVNFPITQFDSITFIRQEEPLAGDTVYITYNGPNVSVINPFADNGVTVTTNNADVTVYSTKSSIKYLVSGTSSNGSLNITSGHSYRMILKNLDLTSNTTAAIYSTTEVTVYLTLFGHSSLADSPYSTLKGALTTSTLLVDGEGTLEVTGNANHGISVEGGNLRVDSGTIRILETDSDGIHCDINLIWNDGTLDIVSAGSDGLDISGNVTINNGDLTINTTAESQRSIKVTNTFTMTGGTLNLNISGNDCKGIKGDADINISGGTLDVQVSGTGSHGISSDTDVVIGDTADVTIVSSSQDGKCIKSDGTVHINGGNLTIVNSGDMSKGIKADGDISITGGTIDITASGSTVMQVVNNQNEPAYCTAIKCDTDIDITGGDFTITLPTSNHGGKGISADGAITIDGGTFNITTQGNGASYTVSGSTKDAYTSSCLRSNGNMSILSGNLTLSSSGTGGKGIKVGTSSNSATLTIGTAGGNNDDLTLNVTTSGERITVTSGGGGPWGGGDYANPKGIKSQGNLTINSGNITVNCTQSQNEGGECIESKATLTINGGNIEAYSIKDDAVNARTNLTINGGVYYAHSDANDGTDSNGTMFINGGFNISNGSRQPEEGFDCDNNQFKITGSTSIGTGGGTSNPSTNVCTQPSLKINTQPGYAIQILKADGTVICTYQCPEFTGGGGGWPGPGGGGNSMVMLFTDPQLQTGQSYTVKYNGTISGGTEWHGYYTGNVTYTGGQTVNVNVNSMVTTVNAGGGGGW